MSLTREQEDTIWFSFSEEEQAEILARREREDADEDASELRQESRNWRQRNQSRPRTAALEREHLLDGPYEPQDTSVKVRYSDEILERVRAGVNLLNEQYGKENWPHWINTKLWSEEGADPNRTSVAAQVTGTKDSQKMLKKLFGNDEEAAYRAVEHGLAVWPDGKKDVPAFEQAWKDAIELARQGEEL